MGIPQEENVLPRGGFNSNPAAPNRQDEEYPFPISNGPEAEDLYSELASALHPGNNYIMNMRAGRGRGRGGQGPQSRVPRRQIRGGQPSAADRVEELRNQAIPVIEREA